MKPIRMVRLAGPVVGAVSAVGLSAVIENAATALIASGAVFLFCNWVGHIWWCRLASPEDRRCDLEDRVRNPPA